MEFHFGDDRFAESANRVRVAPHIRQEPARRFGRAIRRDVVPTADPLDGGRRPSPSRVAGALAGRRDRPFQRPRDLPQGPTENPAAPDQHHHLVIMLADQLADPLTGRVAAGTGVDFPAAFPHSRHDTMPAGPDSAGTELLQPVFGADRARIRGHMTPAGSRRRPKLPVSPGRPAPRPTEASVSSPRSAVSRSAERCSFPQTPRNKRNRQHLPDAGPRFFVPSSSGPVRSHKIGCVRSEKSPLRREALAEAGRRAEAYT